MLVSVGSGLGAARLIATRWGLGFSTQARLFASYSGCRQTGQAHPHSFLAVAKLVKRFASLPPAASLLLVVTKLDKRFVGLPPAASLLLIVANLVKRFAGLPPAEPPFCSHRNVAQRCALGGSVVR